MEHLEDKGAASAHLDLADIEAEPEEGFEEGAFAIGLATDGDDLRDWECFAEGYGGGLEAVVGLKSRRGIGAMSPAG